MKKSFKIIAIAFAIGVFTLTSCSQEEKEMWQIICKLLKTR